MPPDAQENQRDHSKYEHPLLLSGKGAGGIRHPRVKGSHCCSMLCGCHSVASSQVTSFVQDSVASPRLDANP